MRWKPPRWTKLQIMEVLIPTPLRSYTGRAFVEADGETLAALLADLDRRYPGIRFRMLDEQNHIRRHIRIFVNGAQTFDPALALCPSDEVTIVQALSGG
jgi:sulfur-carrier protein